jgi:hypothetical protein
MWINARDDVVKRVWAGVMRSKQRSSTTGIKIADVP